MVNITDTHTNHGRRIIAWMTDNHIPRLVYPVIDPAKDLMENQHTGYTLVEHPADGVATWIKTDQLMPYVPVSATSELFLARIDENESLLSVAQHEIDQPDHCDMHDKYTPQYHACRKRKWYKTIAADWKRVIEERITYLRRMHKEMAHGKI